MSSPTDRPGSLSVLAKAPAADLARRVAELGTAVPDFEWMRAPQFGTVMVRGRVSGTGAAFNLGEMTVTRCTLRLAGGAVGHAMVAGRSKAHAERVALCDAMLQTDLADRVHAAVVEPLAAEAAARRAADAAKAAATKVEFFTLVRGED